MYTPATMSGVCVCMIYRMCVKYVHTCYTVSCMCVYNIGFLLNMYTPATMSRVCVCMIYRMCVKYVHSCYYVRCMCVYDIEDVC